MTARPRRPTPVRRARAPEIPTEEGTPRPAEPDLAQLLSVAALVVAIAALVVELAHGLRNVDPVVIQLGALTLAVLSVAAVLRRDR